MPRLDFNVRHPVWQRYSARWEMAYDFKRGGQNVLNPDHDIQVIRWSQLVKQEAAAVASGGLAPEDNPPESKYSAMAAPSASYLFKHEKESKKAYDERHRRQINIPSFQFLINTCTSGVLHTQPVREGVQGIWEDIHRDMDLVGTDVDAFFRRSMALALTFGRIHAVSDRPHFADRAINRADQVARGERAYTFLITPLELTDWATDRYGRLLWAVVMEEGPDLRQPGGAIVERGVQYRVWTPSEWVLYREIDKDAREPRNAEGEIFEEVGRGNHGVGRVPISTLFACQVNEAASMAIESPLCDHLDINRSQLNRLSELDESERSQTFEILGIPVADGESMGRIDIGPWSAFTYPATAGAPAYIGADPSHPQGKLARIETIGLLSRQYAAASRGKAEYSKEERSAEALRVESGDKQNQLALWLQALIEYDEDVHENLAAWEGEKEAPTVAYQPDFDSKATYTAITELVQLVAVPVVQRSTIAQAALVKPVIRRIMTDSGEDKSDIEAAMADVEAKSKEDPEPVIVEEDGTNEA